MQKRITFSVLALILVAITGLAFARRNAGAFNQQQTKRMAGTHKQAPPLPPPPVSALRLAATEVQPISADLPRPTTELTFRNVGDKPIVYATLVNGPKTFPLDFLLADDPLLPQAEVKRTVDDPAGWHIGAVVFADGAVEGESIEVKKATFYVTNFRAAMLRYLEAERVTRAAGGKDEQVAAEMVALAEKDIRASPTRAGALEAAKKISVLIDRGGSKAARELLGQMHVLVARTALPLVY